MAPDTLMKMADTGSVSVDELDGVGGAPDTGETPPRSGNLSARRLEPPPTPARSITRQLTLIALLTSGGTLVVGSIVLALLDIGPSPFALMFGVSTVLSTSVIWYSSRRALAQPMLTLAATVQNISAAQDYSLRITKQTDDEVGVLLDNVNELLRRMEERDQHYRGEGDRLEAEVKTRTRELRESNERLEAATAQAIAANRAKSQFIANMSHEIRTPMNGVMGMAEVLLSTNPTSEQRDFIRIVLESAEDLLSIINNILDFSKVEAGKLEKIDNSPFSPVDCVEKVSELLVARARPKGLELIHECADDVPPAMLGDGKRLRQVLTNVIGNAIKFTEHGKIVVRITTKELVDDVCTIRFEVVDTGIGIPSHLHEHVFEGFSQADTSTTRQFGGTGLGLAISKHLVELMGGQIGVISRPGVGSNFWFTIKGELCHPATASDRDLSGVHALIVSRTHIGRDTLRLQLATCGGSSTVAASAEKALEMLRDQTRGEHPPFDVALIDTQALDGLVLAQEIRADPPTKSLPLVLVSTVDRGQAELKEAGVDGSLHKPVQRDDLFACVAKVTGRLNVTLPDEDGDPTETECVGRGLAAHVLLAEDNSVNRKVATTMLERLGCQVDVVFDGAAAVEAVQRTPYDLVFLDCQMPHLDGYEAARRIRQLEQEGARLGTAHALEHVGHLPLSALTAHTAPGDRARSLDSGMDDYIGKPFKMRALHEVLTKWVGHHVVDGHASDATPPRPEAPAATVRSTDPNPINEAALEDILELDRTGPGGILAELIAIFLDDTPDLLDTLWMAVRSQGADQVARSAHALKSSALSVGAEPLGELCKQLETLGRAGTVEGTLPLAEQIAEHYRRVRIALENRLQLENEGGLLTAGARASLETEGTP